MNLPANKVEVDPEEDMAIKNHPKAATGEHKMIIFLRPIHPEIIPPIGAKTVKQKKSKEANQDCWVVFKPKWGNEMVVNPSKTPKEALIRHTDNVAKI